MGKTLDVGKDFAANLKLKRSFFPIFFQQNLKNAAGHNFSRMRVAKGSRLGV